MKKKEKKRCFMPLLYYFYLKICIIADFIFIVDPPTITTAPESKVVSSTLVPNIVSFNCEAEGFASPIITWRHLGKSATSGHKYLIRESEYAGEDGGYGRRSTLTLLSIDVLDTGTMTCQADAAPSVKTNDLQLPGVMATASLTVFG